MEKFSNREWLLLLRLLVAVVAIPFPKGVGIGFDALGACCHGVSQAAAEDDRLIPYRLPCGYASVLPPHFLSYSALFVYEEIF